MNRRFIVVSSFGFLVACYGSQESSCGSGPTPVPAASPTPAPPVVVVVGSPTPSQTPQKPGTSCTFDYMILRPSEGLVLANNVEATLDLTPYQTVTNPDGTISQLEVSRACNDPRISSVVWSSSSASVVVIAGGFNPTIRRFGVGLATITATLEGKVSNAITVRTP